MDHNRQRGQTSIFLLIIFIPMILIALVVIDAARIRSAERQAEDAVRSAAKSVLAAYSSKIKDDYGLFVLGPRDEAFFETQVREYLCKNLGIEENTDGNAGRLKLYDYNIEDIRVTPVLNLMSNEVTRKGILEYMKYRAPLSIVEETADKLNLFGNASKMAGAYKRKTILDKTLGCLDRSIRELKRYTEGWAENFEFPVNAFNLNCSRENTIEVLVDSILKKRSLQQDLEHERNRVSDLAGKLREQEKLLEEIEESIRRIRELVESADNDGTTGFSGENNPGGDGDGTAGKSIERENLARELERLLQLAEEQEKKVKETKNHLNDVCEKVDRVEREIAGLKETISEEWRGLKEVETFPYINSCGKALDALKEIEKLGKEIESAVKDLRNFLRTSMEGNSIFDTFISELEDEITRGLACMLQQHVLEGTKKSLQANMDILEEMKDTLMQYDRMVADNHDLPGDRASMLRLLAGRQNEYVRTISIEYERKGMNRKEEDPRGEIIKKAEDFLSQKILQYGDIKKAGFDPEQLPSMCKSCWDNRDGQNLYEGNIGGLEEKVEFNEKDASFSASAFGYVERIGGDIGQSLFEMRDEIYINEYILETFHNAADKGTRDRGWLFEGEVEYIIHGMASGRLNRLAVRGEITLLRFAMNTLHVYSDARKKAMATSLATAVAGWWTGGAGIPIISNMIMCSWGLGEAILDTARLLDGKKVPFYKTQSDWQLDIGLQGGKDGGAAPGPGIGINFDYEDYLRLLLLTVDPDRKMDRIEDLICLNLHAEDLDWRLQGYNTGMRVEAVISVDYLFIPRLNVPGRIIDIGGRKEFRLDVIECY